MKNSKKKIIKYNKEKYADYYEEQEVRKSEAELETLLEKNVKNKNNIIQKEKIMCRK